jgi:hypothetical protein
MLWSLAFWKGAAERAVKTFAQAAVAFIAVGTTGILDLDYGTVASVAGAAALASLLTSIGNADFVAGNVLTVKADPYTGVVPGRVLPDAEASTDITPK